MLKIEYLVQESNEKLDQFLEIPRNLQIKTHNVHLLSSAHLCKQIQLLKTPLPLKHIKL